MIGALRKPWLPLLGKELREIAARRRTYVVRTVLICVVAIVFFLLFRETLVRPAYDPRRLRHMGAGREMFDHLMLAQFVAIYCLLPAMASGTLTREKERRSLELLLLADLRPSGILLEKLLSRLLPMLTIIMLSMPLMAIAYAFGGVTSQALTEGVFILLATCLQVGAFALMCSAFCRTTASAFLCSYLGLGFFYTVPALMLEFLAWAGDLSHGGVTGDLVWSHVPVYVWCELAESDGSMVWTGIGLALVSAAAFFGLARVILLPRAFVRPRRIWAALHHWLDRFWGTANVVTGGIVLWEERPGLPRDRPVAWREVRKRSLGTATRLLRILLIVQVPVVFLLGLFCWGASRYGGTEAISQLLAALWLVAAVAVIARGAGLFPVERTRQTLDVLLTTPMTGRQIVKQKAAGIRRLLIVLAVPLASVILVEAHARYFSGAVSAKGDAEYGWIYLLAALLAVVVYLPMLAWFALWVGLKTRTAGRAVLISVILLVCWCALPLMGLRIADSMDVVAAEEAPASYLLLLSPAAIVAGHELAPSQEAARLFDGQILVAIGFNFLWYGWVLFHLRWMCLSGADRYLGRVGAAVRPAERDRKPRGRPLRP